MRRWPVAALVLHAACKFPYPADVPDDDVTGSDAADTCVASTTTCDDARGEYIVCSPAGEVETSLHCPLGCAPDEEKCLDIDPHNGLAMYLDMVADPPDVVLDLPALIDTNAGAILNGPTSVSVPTFLHEQAAADPIRVFVVGRLTVRGSMSAIKQRSSPFAILARGEVEILGPLDISADRDRPGPGGSVEQDIFNGNRSCEGEPVMGLGPTMPSPGGSGAGGATAGGRGAGSGQTMEPAGGGASVSIEPLGGGCTGGSVSGNGVGSLGGAGGGAMQISSRVSIRIADQGAIDASGGGATASPIRIAGAGGGAGGVILLEAPQVILDGPLVRLSTKGGGGAGGSEATPAGHGSDGGLDATPASGGSAPALAAGGHGGTTTAPEGGFWSQLSPGNGGGGGGAAGRTVIETTAGAIAPQNGAAIRGPETIGRLRTRRIP